MSETLTQEILERSMDLLRANETQPRIGGLEVQVFAFQIQHRKPRSKKLRIRKKREKNPRNWRAKRRQCFKMAAPLGRTIIIISPDMKPEIDRILAAHQRRPGQQHG